jgi:8-oxo-dGTP diphosphatase
MSESKDEYPRPSLTADVVAVALDAEGALRVLFIRRGNEPFAGAWALPGGFCEPNETVARAALRELEEETGLTGVEVEELHTFSTPGRDPRGWVVTVAHLAFVPADRLAQAKGADDATEAAWLHVVVTPDGAFRVEKDGAPAGRLAFDHHDILECAITRLRDRADELAFALLPATFSLDEARRAFEAILGLRLDPEGFRGELLQRGLARQVGDAERWEQVLKTPRRWPATEGQAS